MLYCAFFFLSSPLFGNPFRPIFSKSPRTLKVAEHIRDVLSRPAPQDPRRILHDLLLAVPEQEGPSLAKSDNHLRILGILFSLPFSLTLASPITLEQWRYVPTFCMAVGNRPLRDVNGWDDWLRRACPPNILDIANRALVAWANCEHRCVFPPAR